jgi:hypothetical protein
MSTRDSRSALTFSLHEYVGIFNISCEDVRGDTGCEDFCMWIHENSSSRPDAWYDVRLSLHFSCRHTHKLPSLHTKHRSPWLLVRTENIFSVINTASGMFFLTFFAPVKLPPRSKSQFGHFGGLCLFTYVYFLHAGQVPVPRFVHFWTSMHEACLHVPSNELIIYNQCTVPSEYCKWVNDSVNISQQFTFNESMG